MKMSPSFGQGGAVLVVLLASCISYSSQLSGKSLSVQSSSSPGSKPQLVTYGFSPNQEHLVSSEGRSRRKRDVATEPGHPGIQSSANLLNDSHNSLIVHWAGKDVIICLAKDMNANSSTSTLYISRDYGGKWENATHLLTQSSLSSDEAPLLDKFFNHPENNGKFVFTDIKHNVIYTTDNYGAEFRGTKVLFVPDEISFDPFADETILAYEKSTPEKRLWISKDFGLSWTMAQEFVKTISWDESSHPAKLYIQREEPDEHSVVITSESLFTDHGDNVVVLQEVEEFEIKDDYMFATKKGPNNTLELWISYKHGSFLKAYFPTSESIKNYHVADVSDGQIFVCLTHENSISNLYVGSQPPHSMESPRFSLSLSRIVFYKPSLTWSQSWISAVTEDSFVDLHHLEGLRGVYIASVLKSAPEGPKDKINFNEVISLVTFDNGGQWEVLKPPEFDDDGNPIYCHATSLNCSLHVSQRLSELYPLYRAVPMLTRRSAVGLVVATGTVNNSLKGHLGVFISTDGAVTWRQILQGNYLFNFGDHGGVIVAVKFYKVGDATDTLLYTTDEGETWKTYKFYEEKVRVLGLMTEPGENTTVFFIFGSLNGTKSHSWILIKVDLHNAFERQCNASDYKAWSPWDSKKGRDCLLGKKDVYERRIPSHSCYNGRSYERLVNTTKCICSPIDFECDFGYAKNQLDGEHCTKDLSENSPGVKPEWCKPGDLYYNLTKGYRKVPGDECEGGDVSKYLPETRPCAITKESEFMLVAKRDSVLRIDLNDFQHVETLPLLHARAVIAIDFDMKNNTIYWADVNRDNIMRLRLDGNSTAEHLVSNDLKSVEGLAFDWISSNLYFCDGANARIEVIRTDTSVMGRMRKIILQAPTLDKPRGIAVHPEKSFLFWTDWSSEKPCIGRSLLDGSDSKRLVENSDKTPSMLKWPNGIAVDYESDRIYWVDAFLDQMVNADLDGADIKILLKGDIRIKHPFAVAIFKKQIFWDDWTTHSIFATGKAVREPEKEVFLVTANHTRLMDLKVYGPGKQKGSNACAAAADGKSNCTHLCLSLPGGTFTCECPDGLKKLNGSCVCPDGSAVQGNGLCSNSACMQNNTFKCASNDFCIPNTWKCDGDDDCGDNSDEDPKTCDIDSHCTPAQFQCKESRTCIPDGWRCDYDRDCPDGSDEENCEDHYPKCESAQHFQCANKRCILSQWRCDGDNDCMDNSDELNCTSIHRGSCAVNEFQCEDNKRCISDQWRCDGDNDCPDGSDEKNCSGIACPSYKFSCTNSKECIMQSWRCDGDKDCKDGSDEENCTSTIIPATTPTSPFTGNCKSMPQMFECARSGKCIPIGWRCDKQVDCGPGDDSDESGCDTDTTDLPEVVTMEPPRKQCPLDRWQCDSGECIREMSVCDGYPDCSDHSDEKSCHDPGKGPTGCGPSQVRCGLSSVCVAKTKVCDGRKDCPNNADESACVFGNTTSENPCNSGQHLCDDEICVPLSRVCDGRADCTDGTDEMNCDKWQKVYQVDGISVNPEGIEAHEIKIEWWVVQSLRNAAGGSMKFLPSICEMKSDHCTNHTTWITDSKFTFTDLNPFTRYRVAVYVQVRDTPYPPSVYKVVNTIEYDPTEPYQLELKQPSVDEVCASWKKPHTPNGIIKKYTLYFSPPSPPAAIVADNTSVCMSNKQSDPPFQSGTKYSFWVVAENSVARSLPSATVTYVYKGDAGEVVNVKAKDVKRSSASLSWTTKGDKNHYFHYNITITTLGSRYYQFQRHMTSQDPYITVSKLAPGTEYKYEIFPIHKEGIRGTSAEGTFKTLGDPLPRVDGVVTKLVSNAANQFSVYWTYPSTSSYNPDSKNWEYAVFYGKTEEDLAEKGKPIIVKKVPALLKDLEACESYFVDVAVVENGVFGPLTEDPAQFSTSMDETAPPKRLRVRAPSDELDDVMVTLTWESPCPEMNKKLGYNITLKDLKMNHEYGLSNISFSNASMLEHRIDVQYGGHYEVTVSTSVSGGRKSDPVYVNGPEIPYPLRLHQCSSCDTPTITWEAPKLPQKVTKKGDTQYIVWVSEDEKFTKSKKLYTNDTVYSIKEHIYDGIYYVAVSVQDAEGLESPRSAVITFHQDMSLPGDAHAVTLNQRSLVGIVVTIIVVVAILLATLAVFVVRHKRLQTSFLNFASSHYSTQSGSATFQQNMEEHDSPVIRGFSDDEPLLVA